MGTMRGNDFCIVLITMLIQYVSSKGIVPLVNAFPPACDSKIYCQGDLLKTVQMAAIYEDSKTFVDMSMLFTPEEVTQHFNDMMQKSSNKPTKDDVKAFLAKNFVEGKELSEWEPSDYEGHPHFLDDISDTTIRSFAQKIVEIWPKLGRKVVDDVKSNPNKHSLIYVPNGFIIPGGRFREFYYWDSYWIVQGLLISEMHQTVRDMLGNFLHMVNKYGFVPNGGRVYYLNRSQPPLLVKMAKDYYDATKDKGWVSANIGSLSKEVQWWLTNKFTTVSIDGQSYSLATYISESLGPRPESYREDITTSSFWTDPQKQQKVFNELKAAAQSGWDFSTRWIFDSSGGINANISFIETSRVVPVDLNAILYGAFADLSNLYKVLEDSANEQLYADHADSLKEAIRSVLWNEQDGIWYDYDISLQASRKRYAASNLAPLWTKAYDVKQKDMYGSKAAAYLRNEGIDKYKGGIPATKIESTEQWDFPNAWPPLQSIVIGGLRNTGERKAVALADSFAKNWIRANMLSFDEHGYFFEKYDAVQPGKYGGGGEYHVQTGFGWTNGVLLELIGKRSSAVKKIFENKVLMLLPFTSIYLSGLQWFYLML